MREPALATGKLVPGATTFRRRLHIDRGKRQREGAYRGGLEPLSDEDIEAHLRGDFAFAFPAVGGGLARFGCIDVDASFQRRLSVLRDVVLELGGEALARAVFVTTGSSSGRGKFVIALAEPTDVFLVRSLVDVIRTRAIIDPRFGHVLPGTLTTFPQDGSGGVVRVLGRNIARDGAVEIALSLDGEVIGLESVIPLDAGNILAVIGPRQTSPARAVWCEKLFAEPWTRTECGGNRGAFRRLVAIAREAIRLYGVGDSGRAIFQSWLGQIARASPDFERPSHTSRDRRNPLAWDRGGGNAWRIARANPTTFRTKIIDELTSPEQRRVYLGIADYVVARGLNSAFFALDYERVRELAGVDDKRHARRAMMSLAKRGFMDLVDRGAKRAKGERGFITFWALVGDGETVQIVKARREADSRSLERMKRRALERAECERRTATLKVEL